MDINKYKQRIGFEGNLVASKECLEVLHRCHVMSIPFEAIDVQLGNRINLDLNQIFYKVIINHRGGYCYELNYLFHWLLNQVGFECQLVSARIFDNGIYGPQYDHMALIVKLGNSWLVDVGYGDLFIKPLNILPELVQEDKFKLYKLEQHGKSEYLLLESLKNNIKWTPRYSFNTRPRLITDFEEQNEYKQSSSESYFVRNRICTMPTQCGRKTILNNIYKVKTNNDVHKQEIVSKEEMYHILESEFQIKLNMK